MVLRDLESVIQEAKESRAKHLDLSDRAIRRLPSSIGLLDEVKTLDLRHNSLEFLPEELGNLSRLQDLYVNHNSIKRLPASIGRLQQLETLHAYNNQLTTLPVSLSELTHLDTLHLYSNRLNPNKLTLPRNLRTLSLGRNSLKSLPQNIGELLRLEELHLQGNELTHLPYEVTHLQKLSILLLYDNRLIDLPDELRTLARHGHLRALMLHNNQNLGVPLEVLGPRWDDCRFFAYGQNTAPALPLDILEYYFRIKPPVTRIASHRPASRQLNETKLILVGRGGVGKTSLVQRLVTKQKPSTTRTEGIAVTNWKVRADKALVRLNVWDFGGQEIMHATHQFFLTERSIYLLVVSNREGLAAMDAEYWLKLIQSFGAESTVLLVRNKIGETFFSLDEEVLREKYPMLLGKSVAADAVLGTGCGELEARLRDAINATQSWRVRIDGAWWAIKEELEGSPKSHLSREDFNAICAKYGEKKPEEQNRLARILKQLGVIVHYWDDPRLRETAVLRPSWLTGGIYLLLNDKKLADARGVTRMNDLRRILPKGDYPPEQQTFLLEVMRKFRLCHEIPKHPGTWLIPELLPEAQPTGVGAWLGNECLALRYEYAVLPEGLVPRLIAQAFPLVHDKQQWRFGVVLAMEGALARIRADRSDRCVTILVRGGKMDSRKRLLSYIRACFDEMHGEFERLAIRTTFRAAGVDSFWEDYDRLVQLERGDRETLKRTEYGTIDKAKVTEKLNALERPTERPAFLPSATFGLEAAGLPLFVSYCHADRELKAELDVRLKILRRRQIISNWDDGMIPDGEPWNEEILRHLQEAKIILLLVSPEFMASDYIGEHEVPLAMKLHETKEATVIPIKLRRCNWDPEPYAKLQGPRHGEPIVGEIDTKHARDTAWLAVEEAIAKAAARRRSGGAADH